MEAFIDGFMSVLPYSFTSAFIALIIGYSIGWNRSKRHTLRVVRGETTREI